MKWWTGQFSDSENRGSHTDDFHGTKLVNIVLLTTSISMSLWTISSPLRFHFSYILLLTKESAGAMEPTFSLWNISRFSTRSQMPLTPLLGLVTEDNFLGLLNLQTFHSSSTWQGTLGGGRQDYLQVASVCSHELQELFSAKDRQGALFWARLKETSPICCNTGSGLLGQTFQILAFYPDC